MNLFSSQLSSRYGFVIVRREYKTTKDSWNELKVNNLLKKEKISWHKNRFFSIFFYNIIAQFVNFFLLIFARKLFSHIPKDTLDIYFWHLTYCINCDAVSLRNLIRYNWQHLMMVSNKGNPYICAFKYILLHRFNFWYTFLAERI